ncbi:MAG TPA: LysM domain-containing protein [Solirubrobacteraceae bacterium]|nr:LysM domain-containing protein [Solirubrobacteraceae bacterium]
MAARNPARYLAPVAIVAIVAGGYLIVEHHVGARTHHTSTHRPRNSSRPRGKFAKTTFYTVQANQTMTGIARLTGMSLSTLEALNPRVNPNALQTGQRLRLRR